MKIRSLSKPQLLWQFLRGSKRYFLISILTSLAVTAADIINPQIVRYTVDTVLGNEPSSLPAAVNTWIESLGGAERLRQHLWILSLIIIGVALFSGVSRYLHRVFNTKAAETLVQHIRHLLFAHIQRLPFAWHMKNQTGDIIQRCTSDVETVKNFLSEQLTSILRIVIQIAVSLTVMYTMNVKLAIAATVTLPIILLYSAFFGGRVRSRFKECDEAEGVLSAITQENLTGVRVVRAFGREAYERDRFGKQNEEYTNRWLRLSRLMAAFWGVGDFIAGAQVMLILILGVISCVEGTMTPGDFIAFLSYNTMLSWPIRRLGRMISEMSKAGISIDRLSHILSAPPEQDVPDAVEPDLHGDIVFEDVCFAYEGCPELLSHISFTAKAGSTVGILGGTGSGKSTLMHLLNRLYPLPQDGSGGRITIGGVDIARIKAAHLRRGVGMVLQEPYLFSRSIAENIGITGESISHEEIREAARIACLDDTVTQFAEGYDTFVGERGVTLSGGQKQRAAIARMLTQKAPIMVFDDSLSAVDAETDAKIRAALLNNLGGSTVFLISHRTATLMHADLILVLDNGRILESGTHTELMQKENGMYRRIYDMQLAGTAPRKEADI
jgi:ATP-binding cassette subfamily B protein